MKQQPKAVLKLIKNIENSGWIVALDDNGQAAYLSQGTPLGEDFGFDVEYKNADELVKAISDYYEDFDPEEHAMMWWNARNSVSGVPQSIRELLDDADAIRKMLAKLTKTVGAAA